MEESRVTKNGISIYSYKNEHLHSFCICLYIKAGPLYEKDEENGLSHLWEHMVFRKLNALWEGKLYRRLDHLGLTLSGSTYKEFVSFSITGAPKYFREAAEIIARIFEPCPLSMAEINLEKKRIRAEIREDDEKRSLDYFSDQIIWADTTVKNTILGSNQVIHKTGKRALQRFEEETLSPGHLFFYVTGAFDNADLNHLCAGLEGYALTESDKKRENQTAVPKDFFKRNAYIGVKNNRSHYIRFSFDVDARKCRKVEMDLLYDILFTGDSCKVFQELSEKTGYIYSYDACYEQYENIGCLYFSFEIEKKNILPAMEKTILLLNSLKQDLSAAIQYVLPTYTDNAEFLLDDPESLNWTMAYERHILSETYSSISARKEHYSRVTGPDLGRIAGEIFRKENLVLTLKTDEKSFDQEQARAILDRLS